MNAVAIGPLVLDGARLAALAGLLAFLAMAEAAARLQRRRLPGDAAGWITAALLAWIVAARIGFVAANWPDFAAHPWDSLMLWQGGYLPAAGWAGGAAVLAVALWRRARAAAAPLMLGAAAAMAVHLAVLAALPRPAIRLPDLTLIGLDGGAVPLAGRQRPVVLNLWATWCPPCRREMPMLADLAATTPQADFILANQGEDADRINAFLAAEGLPPAGIARDPQGRLMPVLGAIGLPSTLVFAGDGRLVAAHTGEISRAALGRMIEQATGGRK